MNKSSTGELTPKELMENYVEQKIGGISKDLVNEIFNNVDQDGQGSVDYEEFIVTCTAPYML